MLDKIEDALETTEQLLALERRKLDTLQQMRECLRAHKVCPELDIHRPMRIMRYYMAGKEEFCIESDDKDKWITKAQFEYIKGKHDDY